MKQKLILALILLLPAALASRAGEITDSTSITYVANEGFMIRTTNHKILVDAIFGNIKGKWCDQPGDSILNKMFNGSGHYNNIDLVLVTHHHLDHFNAPMVVRFMRSNPQAEMVCPSQATALMNKEEDFRSIAGRVHSLKSDTLLDTILTVHNMTIRAMRLKHGSWFEKDSLTGKSYDVHQNVENIGFVVTSDGSSFLHTGDCATDNGWQFERLKLSSVNTDATFMGIGFLSKEGQNILNKFIHSKKIILMHIAPGKADYYRSVLKDYAEFHIFDKPGEYLIL